MTSPSPSAQLVHLGAVSPILNDSAYAIRGKVILVFRGEDGAPRRLRLASLHMPASPDAAPTSIDLILHGRWRPACAAVRRDSLLHVESALVEPAFDTDVNSCQLNLADPLPRRRTAARPRLLMLSADMRPISIATYANLADGLVRAAPELPPSTASSRAPPGRFSIGEGGRPHAYVSMAELWARTESSSALPSRGEKVNFYGVVLDCRAPCTTRGPDLRCEVIVADESSLLTGELKTMAIYCFERDPADCIPFRAVGDVIRAHRIHVGRYNDHVAGTSTVQGVGRFYSTFLLWSHEGTDFLPIASRDPVQVSSSGDGASRAVTHVVTSQDRDKITQLRNWASSYLFRKHKVDRPFLRTVWEVRQAHPLATFLTKTFDLICCVKADASVQVSDGNLKLVVSDGISSAEGGGQEMLVESENSLEQLEHDPSSHFLDFCPSWEGRPRGTSSWVLIRDVTIRTEGSERIAVLNVNRKTSTLVWHPPNSAEVREVRDKFRLSMNVDRPSLPSRRRDFAHGNEYPITELRSPAGMLADADAYDSPASKRLKLSDGSGLRLNPSRTAIRASAQICRHPNQMVQPSTIADIQSAVSERKLGPHRLIARARSCSSPRDLRLICRPWCAPCKNFMKIDKDHKLVECLGCTRKFQGNQDRGMQWAYSVCINLEDSSGRRIDAWIEGDEGSVFFRGIPPVNLLRNVEVRRRIMETFQRLLNPNCEIDCCVMPYEYEDNYGLYHVACKVFTTEITKEIAVG